MKAAHRFDSRGGDDLDLMESSEYAIKYPTNSPFIHFLSILFSHLHPLKRKEIRGSGLNSFPHSWFPLLPRACLYSFFCQIDYEKGFSYTRIKLNQLLVIAYHLAKCY